MLLLKNDFKLRRAIKIKNILKIWKAYFIKVIKIFSHRSGQRLLYRQLKTACCNPASVLVQIFSWNCLGTTVKVTTSARPSMLVLLVSVDYSEKKGSDLQSIFILFVNRCTVNVSVPSSITILYFRST